MSFSNVRATGALSEERADKRTSPHKVIFLTLESWLLLTLEADRLLAFSNDRTLDFLGLTILSFTYQLLLLLHMQVDIALDTG